MSGDRVVVAPEGNKREGDMSSAEIDQCIMDMKNWFARKGADGIEGTTQADVQRLEKTLDFSIPREIKSFLREVNGGIYFMDKKSLSVAEITEMWGDLEASKLWCAGLFPLCGDASSLLVVDTNNNDRVLEWDSDDGCGDEVSSSFASYIEEYRNTLLNGKCDFIRDIGVIESVGGAAKSTKK